MKAIPVVILYAVAFYLWGSLVSVYWARVAASAGLIFAAAYIAFVIYTDKEADNYFTYEASIHNLSNSKVGCLILLGSFLLVWGVIAKLFTWLAG